MLKTKIRMVDDDRPGKLLRAVYQAEHMTRAQAAALLNLSVVSLWMLEIGEAAMESPEMWDEALRIIREAPAEERSE